MSYFDLLFRWNAKINLTALTDPGTAVDRLLLEPLAAAVELPHHLDLMDLGSGGGSPAIPLALALEARRLVMIESKSRKAAFLREAVRATELNAVVESERFEDVAARGTYRGQMDVVSIRAVRLDGATLTTAESFLAPGGQIALFTSPLGLIALPAEPTARISQLPGSAQLVLLRP